MDASGLNKRALTGADVSRVAYRAGTGRVLSKSNYGPALRRWLKHFRKEQILVLFHEELRAHPEATVERVLAFVGTSLPPVVLRSPVWECPALSLPPGVEWALARRLRHVSRDLAGLGLEPPESWRRRRPRPQAFEAVRDWLLTRVLTLPVTVAFAVYSYADARLPSRYATALAYSYRRVRRRARPVR